MKRWHALFPNWAITLVLVPIIILNPIFSYFDLTLASKLTTLSLIPIFLFFYFRRQKIMANIFFVIVMLYFLGLLFNAMDHFNLSAKLSESSLLGVYLLLVFVMLGKLKEVKFEGFISWYLLVVFLFNAYLMFLLYAPIKGGFNDSVIFTLAISKGVVLLIMALMAFAIYLSKESGQTILFLIIVCCFVFSEVLNFITTSYLHFWLYEGVEYGLRGLGLILYGIYVYNFQENYKTVSDSRVSKVVKHTNQLPIQS